MENKVGSGGKFRNIAVCFSRLTLTHLRGWGINIVRLAPDAEKLLLFKFNFIVDSYSVAPDKRFIVFNCTSSCRLPQFLKCACWAHTLESYTGGHINGVSFNCIRY
jgi:hypothetical protein